MTDLTPVWALYRRGTEVVAVPRSPLMIRLRRLIPDDYFNQPALRGLKSFMDAVFIAGPGLILLSLYLPTGGGLLVLLGIACLAIAALYWFAPRTLCRFFLERRGFRETAEIRATTYQTALETAQQ